MTRTLTLDGSRVDGIASFYAEINRLFMTDEDWTLGESLDGLNDVLYGGYGPIKGSDAVRIVWTEHQHAQQALGVETTAAWLQSKLDRPDVFNAAAIQAQMDDLLSGAGKTYYDLVLEVFADHPNIELVLE